MRDLCHQCLEVQHLPYSVVISLNVVKAERHIRLFGWEGADVQRILNEAMRFVSEVARKTVADVKEQLRTGESVSEIDPDSP